MRHTTVANYPTSFRSAVGNIQSTLNKQDGSTPAAASLTKFILYTSPQTNFVGQNPHVFTGIPLGSYWVEGYQTNSAFNEYEYWGSTQAVLNADGQSAQAVINRHTPYCEDFWFEYNGTKLGATNKVPPGSNVTAKATIRNKDTSVSSRTIRLNAAWRYGITGTATALPTVVTNIGPNNAKTVTVGTVKLTSGIENDVYAYIKTYAVFSTTNLTDGWDWGKKFEASTGSKPTVINILISALDGGAVSPIVPGKRYIVTAEFSDEDGQGDLAAAWVYLKNPSDARTVGIGYSFSGRKLVDDKDAGVCRDDGGKAVPVQDNYVCLTHVEKESINSGKGWRLRFIFWMSAKWPNSSTGTDYQGVVTDTANHTTTADWTHKAVDFTALSLPAGKWTVIVHGRSSAGLFYGPWRWHGTTTKWFDKLSRPDGTLSNWMWELAWKYGQVNTSGVQIHRLSRDGMTLQSWTNGRSGNYQQSFAPSTTNHNVLLFDWDDPSDYVDIDNENYDDGFAYASGDALYALLRKLGIENKVVSLVGYSRGAIVVSETVRRLRLQGLTGQHVVFLDGEGGGEFSNEVRNTDFPIDVRDVGPNLWRDLVTDPAKLDLAIGETHILDNNPPQLVLGPFGYFYPHWPDRTATIDNAQELTQLRRISGFDDHLFYAWQGCRSDQYREGYSDPDMAFCGAEAILGANDRPVEWWPAYSTANTGRNPYGDESISHSHYPVYFTDWLYLQTDSMLGGLACAVTPQLMKWENPDNRGVFINAGALTYGVAVPAAASYMGGAVFNGGLQVGTLYDRDGNTDPLGGSVAGWTYHGGTGSNFPGALWIMGYITTCRLRLQTPPPFVVLPSWSAC